MAPIEACQHCAGRIHDPRQRTCPHCLETLQTKNFRREDDLERFRQDRKAHGAPVPEQDRGRSHGLIAVVMGAAAAIMIVAGGTIVFAGATSGSLAQVWQSLGRAFVPLAMGVGLFEMARRFGRKGS